MTNMHSTFRYKREFIENTFITSNNTHTHLYQFIFKFTYCSIQQETRLTWLPLKTTLFTFYNQFILLNNVMEDLLLIYYYKKGQQSTSINTFIRHAHHLLMGVSDEVPPNSKHHHSNTASQILQLQIIGVQFFRRGGQAPRAKDVFEVKFRWRYLLPNPKLPKYAKFYHIQHLRLPISNYRSYPIRQFSNSN